MRDPELVAFVVAIERHLSRIRGQVHVLSPPDFALARRWYEGRVPLINVLAAIDAVVEAPGAISLVHRQAAIEAVLAGLST